MCLTINYEETLKYRQQTGTVTVFKIYSYGNGKLESPFYENSLGGTLTNPGEVVSDLLDSQCTIEDIEENVTIENGLYAFLNKEVAEKEMEQLSRVMPNRWGRDYILVEMKADWKDFVAYGVSNSVSYERSSGVFKKLTLSEEEWNRIFGD